MATKKGKTGATKKQMLTRAGALSVAAGRQRADQDVEIALRLLTKADIRRLARIFRKIIVAGDCGPVVQSLPAPVPCSPIGQSPPGPVVQSVPVHQNPKATSAAATESQKRAAKASSTSNKAAMKKAAAKRSKSGK